jgi:hypothetical protein
MVLPFFEVMQAAVRYRGNDISIGLALITMLQFESVRLVVVSVNMIDYLS